MMRDAAMDTLMSSVWSSPVPAIQVRSRRTLECRESIHRLSDTESRSTMCRVKSLRSHRRSMTKEMKSRLPPR